MSNKEKKHGTGTDQQYEARKKSGQANQGGNSSNRGGSTEQHREAGKKGSDASQGGKK